MKYWYYGARDAHYYAYSNALGEFFWYRFDKGDFLKASDDEIDVTEIQSLERGFMPKALRRKAFLHEHGDAWLEQLIAKNKLIISAEDTLDIAVFKLGRPIHDAYALPEICFFGGMQCRWKVNGEMVEQNNGGALRIKHLTNARPRDLSGKYGQFYRVKGFSSEPNVCFYIFEEWDGVHKVRYEVEDDGTATARLVSFDVVGYPEMVSDMEVPEIVRARRFMLEHGIEWLRERRPENDGPLDRNGLMLLASFLNRPIWPWEIKYDDSIDWPDDNTGYDTCCWKIDDKYLVYCYADFSACGMSRWRHGFLVEET